MTSFSTTIITTMAVAFVMAQHQHDPDDMLALSAGVPIHEDHREAFSNLGLMQQHVSSSDPQWNLSETPRKRAMRSTNSGISTDGLSDIALSEAGSPMAGAHANGRVTPAGLPLAGEPLCMLHVA
jgi:hypothetical protein